MRIAVILIALCLGAFALVVFEAAGSAAAIIDRTDRAQLTESPKVRDDLLAQAQTIVQNDPLQRTLWHARAAEGASVASLARAIVAENDQDRPNLLRASRDFSLRAVQTNPAAASAWLRLALLDEAGVPNPACTRKVCLERALTAAPIGDPYLACPRADAAIRAGLITSAEDPRIKHLNNSGVRPEQLSRCIPSAYAALLFRALLQARREAALQEAALAEKK